ncbi:FAD-dependent oxidoreductase, partial [Glaesserella parasuis]|uniref:FAD-dependent oxidoreductase n=1 Tax=Glaesserella parasuis TaxID=738 RepID=UPI003B22803E
VPFELLDKAGVIKAEPALAHATVDFVGGLRLPNDQTGDCQKFTTELAELAAKQGVNFLFNTVIESIEKDAERITAIHLKDGRKSREMFMSWHWAAIVMKCSNNWKLMRLYIH